jgi:MFS family permease
MADDHDTRMTRGAALPRATTTSRPGSRRSRIFYGWWVVLAVAVGMFLSFSPILTFTFGVFLTSLTNEFGWTRGQVSGAYSLAMLMFAAGQPLTGRLLDRVGARRVILPAVAVIGLAVMSLSRLGPALWPMYGVYAVIGLAGTGNASMAYFSVLARWFNRRRGLAMGLALTGNGLSAFVMPSLAQALIAALGWRMAYVVLGALIVAVSVPIVGLLLVDRPEERGLGADGDPAGPAESGTSLAADGGVPARVALRSGTLWLIGGGFLINSTCAVGCLTHLVPLLSDRGAPPAQAAFAASVLGGAMLAGRLGIGYLLDRFFAPLVAMTLFGTGAAGMALLWSGAGGHLALAAAFLIGAAASVDGVIPYLISRYFGLDAFGQIYGTVIAVNILGWVFGPLLMGMAFDRFGSYGPMLGIFLAAIGVAMVLMGRLAAIRPAAAVPSRG